MVKGHSDSERGNPAPATMLSTLLNKTLPSPKNIIIFFDCTKQLLKQQYTQECLLIHYFLIGSVLLYYFIFLKV